MTDPSQTQGQSVLANERRYRAIFESALDFAIIATDRSGLITDWNIGAEKIFGWSTVEMIGASADRFFTPEDRANGRVQHEMSRALQHGRANDERWYLQKGGGHFWANGEMMPLRAEDGEHLGFIKIVRDETEKRSTAEKQKADQDFLRSVLASSNDCIKVLDLDGKLVLMSEGGQRVMEVGDFEAIRGCAWPDFWRDELNEKAIAAVATAKAGGTGCFLGQANTFAGTPRWWDVTVTPILGANGRPEKLLSISRDITIAHEAEVRRRALLELGDRLQDLDDPSEMAYAAAEAMGTALDVDRAGYGTVDLEAETVTIERDWTSLGITSVADVHNFRDFGSYIEDLKKNEIVAIDDVRNDPRTSAHAIALEAIHARSIINIPIIEHGRLVAIFFLNGSRVHRWGEEQISFLRNVADRTRATVERSKAELRLKGLNEELERRVDYRTRERNRLWETTSDLVGVAGVDGWLKEINPAWTKTLGWTESDLLTRPFLDIIAPADHAETMDVVARLASGKTVTGFTDRLVCMDGSERTVMWTAVPEGPLFYIVGRDLTDRRQMEEQLRQSQKMEAVGQLTGGVAHDFNNLLTVIMSSVDLLKRPNLAEDRRRRYIDAISETTTRAAKLTGQLLAFARRQTLRPEVFDVTQSVRSIGDMVVTLTGSRIRIEKLLPTNACFVNADPSQFETAIINLAVNARDAMKGAGTLTIGVSTSQEIPAIRAHPEVIGDFVTISVTDTGSGIASTDMDRIFEPFFTTKPVGQGTGLGLSQVFGFAKQTGGEVMVVSEPGHGTTFTLFLPRAVGAARAQEQPDDPASVDGHGTCVLVVEDNEAVGSFARQTLEELGYRSVLASDAKVALVELKADASRFDAVFSDVVMPGMDGIQLGQEIRRLYADLPVILTSGYSHVLAQNGTHGFELLQKPYSIEQLSRVLQKAAHWRRLKRVLDA